MFAFSVASGLHFCSLSLALEVSVGKAAIIYVKNGSDVLLPCTFTTCIGFENALFSWTRIVSGNYTEIYGGSIKNKDSKPVPSTKPDYEDLDKYEMPDATHKDREYNISILIHFAEFSDSGKYNCFVKNPKEKSTGKHNATITLKVVVELEKVDNTLTMIILAVVGGVIGLLILVMVTKKLTLFILKKTREKKECLVSSSANDNTENGLAGSKAEQKSAPKA
ncbi:sodium channel subunit beta-4 isoform X2 [Hemicordylus capensis]|uniref:sodium channel subunit beta-4 isoform X2 n=1 Tax=Hemicordylus capensis TaxID=884348 RepID=UPI00230304BF|nr:sodium channel subunit beta-4 isoform X2 [Hemicordylus capensis]